MREGEDEQLCPWCATRPAVKRRAKNKRNQSIKGLLFWWFERKEARENPFFGRKTKQKSDDKDTSSGNTWPLNSRATKGERLNQKLCRNRESSLKTRKSVYTILHIFFLWVSLVSSIGRDLICLPLDLVARPSCHWMSFVTRSIHSFSLIFFLWK